MDTPVLTCCCQEEDFPQTASAGSQTEMGVGERRRRGKHRNHPPHLSPPSPRKHFSSAERSACPPLHLRYSSSHHLRKESGYSLSEARGRFYDSSQGLNLCRSRSRRLLQREDAWGGGHWGAGRWQVQVDRNLGYSPFHLLHLPLRVLN